jgi:asparagine synthase (glutamine-hydrolysing)
MCNGEIYNYLDIINEELFGDIELSSSSDVEVILPLYIRYGLTDALDKCSGEFALVLTENTSAILECDIKVLVARDPIGIRPLYLVSNVEKTFFLFVSELHAVPDYCKGNNWRTSVVPPGTFWSFNDRNDSYSFTRYFDIYEKYNIEKCVYLQPTPSTLASVYYSIRERLCDSVAFRIPSNNEIGILLSDGFNSSLLLSILANEHPNVIVHAFSFGATSGKECIESLRKSNPDFNITHYNIQDTGIELPNDFETIVGPEDMGIYLLLKAASENNIKIVLHGGFLDVLFQSEHEKCLDGLANLHVDDLRRLDNVSGKFDIELRYPYLDKEFINIAMSIHPRLKAKQIYNISQPSISKYLVRRSFNNGFLPNELLWKTPSTLECRYTVF